MRDQFSDYLLNNRFHLMDMSLSIPPILIPIWGFSAISAPEMTITYREIKEGNYEFVRKVVEKASVSALTLENGSQLFNSGFWDWISKIPEGNIEKKDLLLIHFTRINPYQFSASETRRKQSSTHTINSDRTKLKVGGQSLNILSGEMDARAPGKAWLLRSCAPSRYKAGSDFSAIGAEVSLQSLELEYEEFLEFNVGVGI